MLKKKPWILNNSHIFFNFCDTMIAFRSYAILSCFMLGNHGIAQSISDRMAEYLSDPHISAAQSSLLAVDIFSGDTLLSFQSNVALPTASTTKVFSTMMALELLGSEYRFATECYTDGTIKDSVLTGNVWIRGLGDVSFGSKFFHGEGLEVNALFGLVDMLKHKGISKVSGSVIIDGSSFGYEGTPKGWSAWDSGNYYGAFSAGINYYDNAVNYYFSTGKPGSRAQLISTYPNQTRLQLKNLITSSRARGDNSNLQGEAYSEKRTATGKLPAYESNFKVRGSVADPEQNFADVLAETFKMRGFVVTKGVFGVRNKNLVLPDYDAIQQVAKIEGRTVGEIVEWTNKKSVNFFAEGLLNGVAYKLTGLGSNSNGLKVYQQYLSSRMDTTNLRLYDGSGLSRYNRISAKHLCQILSYACNSALYGAFKNSLPIAGKSGTIKDLCLGQAGEGRVFAKSGTMTGVKSYSGFVYTLSGRTIVFTLIASGFKCEQSHIKALMQELLNGLAAL
ncbi:MAG: D-alanyl-D-alanine carboxypeptidase/D-alanyl-D-alanine-endopeptidase [Bacteroidetes bacterium]|nr:D-alanyl-D-alanine carboxypeptidase/D-alanyl-D-alanine-endopeptidase [Bacteroidota bacterium]